MSTRPMLLLWMDRHIRDLDNRLSAIDPDVALSAALAEHGRRWPVSYLTDVTGDGATQFFALPTTFQRDWSRITAIESPFGESPPVYLTASAWSLYLSLDEETDTEVMGVLFATAPGNGDVARIAYLGSHTATTGATSVLPQHQYAVSLLGAAYALEMLATEFASQSDPSFVADTTDHAGRSQRYADRAQRLRELYLEQTPLTDVVSTSSSGIMFKKLVRI